ncbi:hypothetical protein ACFFX0_30975 [Citricoccus parietis]|uniref:Uncharacterized protein n=1 Tax=Citricoccus parietis TaxID=592307 RepID=A0ABV5G8T1_9MICC
MWPQWCPSPSPRSSHSFYGDVRAMSWRPKGSSPIRRCWRQLEPSQV